MIELECRVETVHRAEVGTFHASEMLRWSREQCIKIMFIEALLQCMSKYVIIVIILGI